MITQLQREHPVRCEQTGIPRMRRQAIPPVVKIVVQHAAGTHAAQVCTTIFTTRSGGRVPST
jgi:hypothetical protein